MAKTKRRPVHEAVEGIEKHDGKQIEKEEGVTIVHAFKLSRDAGFVSVSEYNGKKALDIRRWCLNEDEHWHPTPKGIRVPAERVEELLNALDAKRGVIVALLS